MSQFAVQFGTRFLFLEPNLYGFDVDRLFARDFIQPRGAGSQDGPAAQHHWAICRLLNMPIAALPERNGRALRYIESSAPCPLLQLTS